MPVKTDRNDARGIAQLMRLGGFRLVHCKSMAAQETRAVLTARKLVQGKLYDIEMSLRGILRGFGLKVGGPTKAGFASRIIELTEHYPALKAIAKALLAVREVLLRELNGFEKQVRKLARGDNRVRLLMTAPGVGPIVGLTYVAAIDDPARFSSSKTVGAHFGMTPRKYQSGETDITGRISKTGDKGVRAALYEAAHIILTMPVKGGSPKSWAAKLAKRAGMQKAKVALARKHAVILHRMLADGTSFDAAKAARHERPSLFNDGSVLAAVNTASRRLWRWPSASVAATARGVPELRPRRRNAVQPDKETVRSQLQRERRSTRRFSGKDRHQSSCA